VLHFRQSHVGDVERERETLTARILDALGGF
jgi:hypothetical protein